MTLWSTPRKGETIAGRSCVPKFGGKGGNQAAAARHQGVLTAMVGAVGDDGFGAALFAGLDRAKVDRTNVTTLSGVGCGMSVAVSMTTAIMARSSFPEPTSPSLAGQVGTEVLAQGEVLVLQNEIPEVVNEAVARHARHLATILNAAPARPFTTSLPDLVDILIVNAIEAEMLGGGDLSSLETAAFAAERLPARIQIRRCDSGRRRRGQLRPVWPSIRTAGIKVAVASTHGAGDTFVGTLAGADGARRSFELALSTANREAAKLVSTPQQERET